MEADPEFGVATIFAGAFGTGLTNTDVVEEDEPYALVAVAVKVQFVPFVNPDKTIGLDEPVTVILSGEEVTV